MKKKYSLWIRPTGQIDTVLQDWVHHLSEKFAGPLFKPHMTLLGSFSAVKEEAIEKTNQLVKQLTPFPIDLQGISFSTTYYQNVFVRVKSSAKLLEANLLAKEIFGMSNHVFMPHISLLYGNHSMQEREMIVKDILLKEPLSFMAEAIEIVPEAGINEDGIRISL